MDRREEQSAAAMAAKMKMLAIRSTHNHQSMLAFLGAVLGLGFVVVFLHHLHRLSAGSSSKKNILAALSRKTRSILMRKAPQVPSGGHGVVIFFYLAINIIILFTNHPTKYGTWQSNLGSRCAWMAIGNLGFLVFLALRNTPLALISPWSYERLNILHRVAGSLAIVFAILHASLYTSLFAAEGRAAGLVEETSDIMGMVAGLSFLMMGISGVVVRRWCYEFFYGMHIFFWMLSAIAIGMHQPKFAKKIIIVVLVVAGLWVVDRTIRFARLAIYSTNNTAKVTPLPNGGTHVVVAKTPYGASPGKHCFLWLPAVRAVETHPFTIVSTNPLEFVVNSYDGFSKDLHRYASQHPGATIKASIEGPYGSVPDSAAYSRIVFVAGGSGATFTFGTAIEMLQRWAEKENKDVVFIWIIKDVSYLDWFKGQLAALKSDARVSVQIYVTRSQTSHFSSNETSPKNGSILEKEKAPTAEGMPINSRRTINSWLVSQEEVLPSGASTPSVDLSVTFEKPDVAALVQDMVAQTDRDRRVLILACGPDKLMGAVRAGAAESIKRDGPGVELHCEQFGW